jgi:HK97 family phage prohead protease
VERRSFDATLELREGAGGEGDTNAPVSRTLTGYAAVFGEWSEDLGGFRERLERGAFRNAAEHDVRALWNHDPAFVLGRTTNGTLRLAEDERGLRVEIDPPEGPLYAGFLENVRRGDVSQMSFGFSVVADEKSYGKDGERLRVLKEVRLYEVSPVTFPAYTQTEVSLRDWGEQPIAETAEWAESAENCNSEDNKELDMETVETAGMESMAGDGNESVYASILRQRRIRILRAQ